MKAGSPYRCLLRSSPTLLLAGLASCSGGGSGSSQATLLGMVANPSGEGIPGVVVKVVTNSKSAQTTTDAEGNFVLSEPPTGQVSLVLDASVVDPLLGIYPELDLPIVLGSGTSNLSRAIVLPDLRAGGSTLVSVDANGLSLGSFTAMAPDGSALTGPDGIAITRAGQPVSGPLELSITSVAPIDVPMPLPGGLDASAFVTIQPGNAAFGAGLDVTLLNPRRFPVGTMVDIWSFDHDLAKWVNRSDGGQQGIVVDIGGEETRIVAQGVITKGGWHAGALPVDPACATTVAGRVVTSGRETIADVLISLGTAQFARSDASGRFSIELVPAYDRSAEGCVPVDLVLRALSPVSLGSVARTLTIGAALIAPGGTTNIGDLVLSTEEVGSVVGTVKEGGGPAEGVVQISGPTSREVPLVEGAFFAAAIPSGDYTASHSCAAGARTESFRITAGRTTVRPIVCGKPEEDPLQVKVLSVIVPGQPIPDACVTLQGSVGGPVYGTTNSNGIARFENAPRGPYVATAQIERIFQSVTSRVASSVIGVNAISGTIVVPFPDGEGDFEDESDLDGTILNPPEEADLFLLQVNTDIAFGYDAEQEVGDSFFEIVPSGVPFDAAVQAIDLDTDPPTVLGAVVWSGLRVDQGELLELDFDFAGPRGCAFDRSTSVEHSREPGLLPISAALELDGVGHLRFELSDGFSLPETIDLPDLARAKFSGFEPFYSVRAGVLDELDCRISLGNGTPGRVSMVFPDLPTIQSPAQGQSLTSFGSGSTVTWIEGGDGPAGIDFLTISQRVGQEFFSAWLIFAPPDSSGLTVPPVFPQKEMLRNGLVRLNLQIARFDLPGFDYASLFGPSFESNQAAVDSAGFCTTSVAGSFLIGTTPAARLDASSWKERPLPGWLQKPAQSLLTSGSRGRR